MTSMISSAVAGPSKQEKEEYEFEKEKEEEFEKAEGTSKKRKTIDVEEASHNSIGLQSTEPPKQGGRAPRRKLRTGVVTGTSESIINQCMETALSQWNEKSLSKQGPEYELVEKLGFVRFRKAVVEPSSFHLNFTARPKNASEAETKLFFADLMFKIVKDKDSKKPKAILNCLNCRIIGPVGTKTGLYGCKICEVPDIVQHPKGRFRSKVKYPKFMR